MSICDKPSVKHEIACGTEARLDTGIECGTDAFTVIKGDMSCGTQIETKE